jgi:hypothetical protein
MACPWLSKSVQLQEVEGWSCICTNFDSPAQGASEGLVVTLHFKLNVSIFLRKILISPSTSSV